jgi:hypothetical protein
MNHQAEANESEHGGRAQRRRGGGPSTGGNGHGTMPRNRGRDETGVGCRAHLNTCRLVFPATRPRSFTLV